MAWSDNRNGIAPICCSHSAKRSGAPHLAGNGTVSASLSKRNGAQSCPNGPLKCGTGKVERHVELLQLTGKISRQLRAGGADDWMIGRVFACTQAHSPRVIVLPEDGSKPLLSNNQVQLTHRRVHRGTKKCHGSFLRGCYFTYSRPWQGYMLAFQPTAITAQFYATAHVGTIRLLVMGFER